MNTLFTSMILLLLLTACGPTVDYPYCDNPWLGDYCTTPGKTLPSGEDILYTCDENNRVSELFYAVEDKDATKQYFVSYDDPCFDVGECHLLTSLCR